MRAHVKNQHIVPRFLLKHFSNDGIKIWCYDKLHKNIKERSIKNVPTEDFLYDITPGEKEGSFEYVLAENENITAPIIEKIIKNKSLQGISIEDKDIISSFIATQFMRTKASLLNANRINSEMTEKLKDFYNEIGKKIDFKDVDTKKLWIDVMHSNNELAKHLIQKVWILIKSEKQFYTSDNPVVAQNIFNQPDLRNNLGLNSEGIEIYLPLNDSLILGLFCRKTYSNLEGMYLECSEGNIENLNSLQVKSSNRFIFSSHNNFELAKDMIEI